MAGKKSFVTAIALLRCLLNRVKRLFPSELFLTFSTTLLTLYSRQGRHFSCEFQTTFRQRASPHEGCRMSSPEGTIKNTKKNHFAVDSVEFLSIRDEEEDSVSICLKGCLSLLTRLSSYSSLITSFNSTFKGIFLVLPLSFLSRLDSDKDVFLQINKKIASHDVSRLESVLYLLSERKQTEEPAAICSFLQKSMIYSTFE